VKTKAKLEVNFQFLILGYWYKWLTRALHWVPFQFLILGYVQTVKVVLPLTSFQFLILGYRYLDTLTWNSI